MGEQVRALREMGEGGMIAFTLPWPDKALSSNSRIDRRTSTRIRQAARDTGFYLAKEAMQKAGVRSYPFGFTRFAVSFTFRAANMRRYDLDNALSRCKAYSDGIALATGVDDSRWDQVTLRRGEPVDGGCVVVEIEAITQ